MYRTPELSSRFLTAFASGCFSRSERMSDDLHLTIWASFHGDSFEFRSCLFRSDASANDISKTIYQTGVYRKALCQFLYADALIVSFQNQFSSFIVQHSSHLLCLCYTSFCSKVKVLCCIIENCYIKNHEETFSFNVYFSPSFLYGITLL